MQSGGPFRNASFEVLVGAAQSHIGVPLAAECSGKLSAFHPVERFAEEEQLVGRRDLLAQVVRVRVGRLRYENQIDIRVQCPDLLGRFDTGLALGRVKLQEHRRKGLLYLKRMLNCLDGRLTLIP